MKPLPLTHTLVQASPRKTIEYKTTAILAEMVHAVFDADRMIHGPKFRSHMTIGRAIQIAQKWLTKREGRFRTRELKTKKGIRGYEGEMHIDEKPY